MHLVGLLIYTLQYDERCIQRQNEHEGCLGYDAVQFDKQTPVFQRNRPPSSSECEHKSEDGGSRFISNVVTRPQNDTVSHLSRLSF